MKITVKQLKQLIREQVEEMTGGDEGAAEEMMDMIKQSIQSKREKLLDLFASEPDLANEVIALAKKSSLNESEEENLVHQMAAVGGGIAGMLVNEISAMIQDPSLIPWTRLRALQLNDRLMMDGSEIKAAIIGAAVAALASVAVHAVKRARKPVKPTRKR
jgi:hypothetical protein